MGHQAAKRYGGQSGGRARPCGMEHVRLARRFVRAVRRQTFHRDRRRSRLQSAIGRRSADRDADRHFGRRRKRPGAAGGHQPLLVLVEPDLLRNASDRRSESVCQRSARRAHALALDQSQSALQRHTGTHGTRGRGCVLLSGMHFEQRYSVAEQSRSGDGRHVAVACSPAAGGGAVGRAGRHDSVYRLREPLFPERNFQ